MCIKQGNARRMYCNANKEVGSYISNQPIGFPRDVLILNLKCSLYDVLVSSNTTC